MTYDAIIIGGSYAGLSAALQLARARRRVLVVDAGRRRNRFVHESHGFLTQDGADPAVLAATARAQLLAYPTVTWRDDTVVEATPTTPFRFTLAGGDRVEAHRVVLATGVVDELPDLPGLAERWGRSVFHCPYCHGYELDGGPVAVLATHPLSIRAALMLPDWSPTTYFTRGQEPDADGLAALDRRRVTLERVPVARIERHADLVLADGRTLPFAGLFVAPRTHLASPIAAQLGCALEEGPLGAFLQVDAATKETSVPFVFACGDAATLAGTVATAVGDGVRAGIGAHHSMIFR